MKIMYSEQSMRQDCRFADRDHVEGTFIGLVSHGSGDSIWQMALIIDRFGVFIELNPKFLLRTKESQLKYKQKRFWISIRKASSCLFSRRNGYKGKIILGYSICIRLFNKDIL